MTDLSVVVPHLGNSLLHLPSTKIFKGWWKVKNIFGVLLSLSMTHDREATGAAVSITASSLWIIPSLLH